MVEKWRKKPVTVDAIQYIGTKESYDELDKFIRNGVKGPHFDLIEKKHKFASHKLNPISKFQNGKTNHFYN